MSKKGVINLQINEEKFEEVINQLVDEEIERRNKEKRDNIKSKLKTTAAGLVLAGTMVGISFGTFKAFDYAIEKESEINSAKNKEYIEEWEDAQGRRWGEFINEDSDDFEVEGNGWTGSYKSR